MNIREEKYFWCSTKFPVNSPCIAHVMCRKSKNITLARELLHRMCVIQERHTISVLGLLLLNKFLSELIFHRKFGVPEIQEHHTGTEKSKMSTGTDKIQRLLFKCSKFFTCSGNPTRFSTLNLAGQRKFYVNLIKHDSQYGANGAIYLTEASACHLLLFLKH